MKQKGFTLAEGATHINMLQKIGNGFTLAEVLITLAIIGVVAAMTIPTLIAKINSIVTDNQVKVFKTKLIKGLNLTKIAGDMNNTYSSTYDFLINGLSKHYKLSKICDSEHIRDCIPYEEIKYMDNDTEKSIKVADLKTAKNIKVEEQGFEDIAAFVTGDGIPAIVTYNKTCIVNTEEVDQDINSCLAGVYDINGTRKPNKYAFTKDDSGDKIIAYTYDMRAFNGASIGNISLFSFDIVGSKKITSTSYRACNLDDDDDLVCYRNDYWSAANSYCASLGATLPSEEQLTEIAKLLYNDDSIGTEFKEYQSLWNGSKTRDAVLEATGLPTSTYFDIWGGSNKYVTGDGRTNALAREFNIGSTKSTRLYVDTTRMPYALCVK